MKETTRGGNGMSGEHKTGATVILGNKAKI